MPFLTLALLLVFSSASHAEVRVEDTVSLVGAPVMLGAQSRGRFFPRGGEIVDIVVNGESLGRTLSGGDGWAYREYVPKRAGLIPLQASYGGDTDEGYLLVFKEGQGAVLVDFIGGLIEGPYSDNPKEGVKEALKEISSVYPIIYIERLPVVRARVRLWIEQNDMPNGPVLPWKGGALVRRLKRKDIGVIAIVAEPQMLVGLSEEVQLLMTFEPVLDKESRKVSDWEEIRKEVMEYRQKNK